MKKNFTALMTITALTAAALSGCSKPAEQTTASEKVTVILRDISELELIVRRNPDRDKMVAYGSNLKILNPCLIGDVAEFIGVTNVLLNILPALFDNFVVHSLTTTFLIFVI